MDAFAADVLIYAAAPGHALGRRVLGLFPPEPVDASLAVAGVGSVLLIPEVLMKPQQQLAAEEVIDISALLRRLDLMPVDEPIARSATVLGAAYGLKPIDAVHLATAVSAGADRFITNNSRDFTKEITEIDITYPTDLPDPAS